MEKIVLNILNEFDPLSHVVMGTALGYHRDRSRVEVVNETQKKTFDAGAYPTEKALIVEFDAFRQALENHGVHV